MFPHKERCRSTAQQNDRSVEVQMVVSSLDATAYVNDFGFR